MNIQERVAALFNKYSAMLAEEAPVSLATAVLQGGQEIQTAAEEWAIGVDVFVVNDEGEQIPLPDGEYTLEDGTEFTVVDGKVNTWEMPEAPVEEEAKKDEEKMSEDVLTREEVAQMIQDAVEAATTNLSKQFKSELGKKDAEIQKLAKAATPSLPKAPARRERQALNLTNLSTDQRVAAIQSHFMNL